jgi:hypothetical protein
MTNKGKVQILMVVNKEFALLKLMSLGYKNSNSNLN